MSLSPSTGIFNKGCSFSIDINLDTGGAQTDGTDAILFYDPTRFNATLIRSGTIYSDYPGNSIDPQNGKITISGLASVSSAFAGSGVLATIDFIAQETAPEGVAQIKFDFDPNDKAKTTDSNVVERGTVADILTQITDGSYTIGAGSCVATGSAVPRGSTGDGVVVPTKVPPTKPLPQSADFQTTLMVGFVGSLMAILGIIGLALL
ncbi:hypothetical protein KKI19_04045 [Patescibacteria group bacterium]|nr:hypothetical protein [Patescibacteria group bacterium]